MTFVRSILSPTRMGVIVLGALTLGTAVLASQLAGGGGPEMTWTTVDGGGGVSSGTSGSATLQITGTIGQHDAFIPMTAGNLTFTAGFWHGVSSHQITCPADVAPPPSGDNMVGVEDLLLVITSWGPGGAGDATHDGTVNVDDLLAVIAGWGACP